MPHRHHRPSCTHRRRLLTQYSLQQQHPLLGQLPSLNYSVMCDLSGCLMLSQGSYLITQQGNVSILQFVREMRKIDRHCDGLNVYSAVPLLPSGTFHVRSTKFWGNFPSPSPILLQIGTLIDLIETN